MHSGNLTHEITCPAFSRACLSREANPVNILVWIAPDKAKNGKKHTMTRVSFQLNKKAMIMATTTLVKELTIIPIWEPVAYKAKQAAHFKQNLFHQSLLCEKPILGQKGRILKIDKIKYTEQCLSF